MLNISEDIFSPFWFFSNIITSIILMGLILFGRGLNKKNVTQYTYFFGFFFILSETATYLYCAFLGKWTLDIMLPFNMCDFTLFSAIILMFTRNQLAYEINCFWGIPSALLAFITPQFLNRGDEFFLLINYFISHACILLGALWSTYVLQMKPRLYMAPKIFLWSQLIIPIMGLINYVFNTNFMYINKAPSVDNIFITGNFPFSLIGLEIGTVFFFVLIYLFFYFQSHLFSRRDS